MIALPPAVHETVFPVCNYWSAIWPYMAFAGVFLFIVYLYEKGDWRD